MAYILFHTFIVFTAVIGLIELLNLAIVYFYKSSKTNCILIVYPKSESIEYELRSITARLRNPCGFTPQKIYCINKNLTEEAKEICNHFRESYELIEIIDEENIKKIIGQM